MKYITVNNIEKYHPGYKDRELKWCKMYFTMVHGDTEFEMIKSEIDKWRYVSLIILELQAKSPLPLSDDYFKRKGFDLTKRKLADTLGSLRKFVTVVTEDGELCDTDNIKKSNIKKIKNKSIEDREDEFQREVFNTEGLSRATKQGFFDYWTERNKSGTKMKYELQPTFDINRRLKRWVKNDFNKTEQDTTGVVL